MQTYTEQPKSSVPSWSQPRSLKSVFDKKSEVKVINLADIPSGDTETKPTMKILNLADLPNMTENRGSTSLRESQVSSSTQKSSVVKTLNIFDLQELSQKEKKVLKMGKKLKKEKLIISQDGNVKKEDNETTLMLKSMTILEDKKEESEEEVEVDQEESELNLEGEIQNEIQANVGEEEVEEEEIIEAVFDDYMKNYETNNSMEEMGIINEYKETILKTFLEERNKGDSSMISDRNISFTEAQNKSLNEDLKKKLEDFPSFLKDAEEKGVLEELISKKKEELEEKRESKKINFVKKPTGEEEVVLDTEDPRLMICTTQMEQPKEDIVEIVQQPLVTLEATTKPEKPYICIMEVQVPQEETVEIKEETFEQVTLEARMEPEKPNICIMEVQVPQEKIQEIEREPETENTLKVNEKEEKAQVSHKLIIIKEERGNEEEIEEETQGMALAFNKRRSGPQVMSQKITVQKNEEPGEEMEETEVVQIQQNQEQSFEHKMENLNEFIQDAKEEGFFDELVAEKRRTELMKFRSETQEEKKRMVLAQEEEGEEEEEVKGTMIQAVNLNREELDVEDVAENLGDYVQDAIDNGLAEDLAEKRREKQTTKAFVNPLADKTKHNEAFTFKEIKHQMMKDAQIEPEVRQPEPVKQKKPVLKPKDKAPGSDIEFSDAFNSENEESQKKVSTQVTQKPVQVSQPLADRELDSFSRKRYGDQKDFNLSRTRLNKSNQVSGRTSRVRLGYSDQRINDRTSVGLRSTQNQTTYNGYQNRNGTSNQNARVAGRTLENGSELKTSRIGGQHTKDIYNQFESVKEMKPIHYTNISGNSKISLSNWKGCSNLKTSNGTYRSPTQNNTIKTYSSNLAGRTQQTRNLQTPDQNSEIRKNTQVGTLKSILQSNLNPSHTEKKYSSYNPSSLSSGRKDKISHARTPSTRTGKKKINLSNYTSKNLTSSGTRSTSKVIQNSSTKYQGGSGYKVSRNVGESSTSVNRRVVSQTKSSLTGGNRVGDSRRIGTSTHPEEPTRIQTSSRPVPEFTKRSLGVKTNGKRRIKL